MTITTRLIPANGLTFETDTCGSGERFALLLHGFPENKYSWRFQMPLLERLGYRAWAPNLRGYGRTSRPKGVAAYGVDQLVGDVAALFEAARREAPISESILIAHDWGAVIAWATAIRKAVDLDRLVIMNVPHPAVMRKGLNTWAQLKKSWYVFFFQIPGLPERLLGARAAEPIGRAFTGMAIDKTNFAEKDIAVYRQSALEPGALTAMVNYYRAAARLPDMKDVSAKSAPVIETPTLMVWGEEDAALGKELTYGTEEYVRDLTIRYLPRVSHWVQQEAPQIVNPMLEAFLQGRDVPYAEQLVSPAAAL